MTRRRRRQNLCAVARRWMNELDRLSPAGYDLRPTRTPRSLRA